MADRPSQFRLVLNRDCRVGIGRWHGQALLAQQRYSSIFLHFPHNLAPDFLQYTSERPERTSHDEKSKKAKTIKGKLVMKNSNIQFKATTQRRKNLRRGLFLIPLVVALAGLAFSPTTARALNPPPDGGYPNETTAEGDGALSSLTTGGGNTALGSNALNANTTGNNNTATGTNALRFHITGDQNTATGRAALVFNADGEGNTATGRAAMGNGTTGFENTATGWQALFNNTGDANTATAAFALWSNTTGEGNAANGHLALYSNTTGDSNTANGRNALINNTTGSGNTANGVDALYSNTTGNNNVALGNSAGGFLTTGDNNIVIVNDGVAGESNHIRIGSVGTHTSTFIAGISGAVVAGAAVKVNANGQLGVAASSERFKAEIKPMDKASEAILALKPVTFRYKKELDPKGSPQFGLVAEQVAKVNPALVDRDGKGEIYTVRYEAVNAMLLNEFLKEHRTVQELEATVAQQQQEIQALTASLKEQASQIQKVSAQLEVSKPAPQMVINNP
jgi:Chaperone of endosialidase